MIVYHLRCPVCALEVESNTSELVCLDDESHSPMVWFRIVQRPDSDAIEGIRNEVGLLIMTPNISDSSPRYKQWYHSEKTQAKLKSGELVPVRKDNDLMHM